MIAFNRWIAVSASAGLVLSLAGLAGCITGHQSAGDRSHCAVPKPCAQVPCAPGCGVNRPARPVTQSVPTRRVFEAQPARPKSAPNESIDKVPAPPMPAIPPMEEKVRFPFPIPEPITEARPMGNPFMTVSREVESSTEAIPAPRGLSRAWADALGLPSQSSSEVEPYHSIR